MNDIVDLGFRIKKINDLLCKRADEMMQEMGVTFSQHHILIYLMHRENHTSTLKDMEHRFRVSQATMAGIAKRMEEKEVITSYFSPNDKRVKMVCLTKKGEEICEQTRMIMKKSEQAMRSLYSEEEMVEFDKYLSRLFHALDKEDRND